MRVLLVEDDVLLADAVRRGLLQAGLAVDHVCDGEDALTAFLADDYDAAVLDLGLPGRDGLAVLREVRSSGRALPILILTARDAVTDRVRGLDAGADDYLAKPFALSELQARLRALLRRARGLSEPLLRHGRVALDPAARIVTLDGKPVELSARELATLQEFLAHPGRVLSRTQLEDRLYGWGEEIESNAVEVYIHHLRRKLYPELIRTIRGVGYLLPKET